MLVGYPDYNSETAEEEGLTASMSRDLADFWLDSLSRGYGAKPLPGTKTEVEQLEGLLKEKGWQVSTYLEGAATEGVVKQVQAPKVVHLATHGYFFENIQTDHHRTNRMMGMETEQVVQDPLLRSGLLFAGANTTLKGEQREGENGLLSAREAAALNLEGTELVVLSACETGRGELRNAEGVYGLRKAIADAGARNIIMSLWKVDDKVTQEFMTLFYSH